LTSVILMAFLGLGVTAAWREMQVACGCWGGTMLVGPLWFCEHGGMFLMALAADDVMVKRLLRPVRETGLTEGSLVSEPSGVRLD
jgi:hypothetical protein